VKICLFSSGSLSLYLIEELLKLSSFFVFVTKPDKPKGRNFQKKSNVAKEKLLNLKLNLKKEVLIFEFDRLRNLSDLEFKNYQSLVEILKNIDIAIVCDFGLIIPENLINLPKIFVNVHPSLLPLYRGPSPIQYSLLNGDKLTGLTICLLSKKVDAGDIVIQEVVNIFEEDNYLSLKERISYLVPNIFIRFLDLYKSDNLYFIPQDESKSTVTKKIDDTALNLNEDIHNIHNKVRAFFPDAYIFASFQNQLKRIKILKTKVINDMNLDNIVKTKIDPFFVNNKRLFLKVSGNLALEVLRLKIEGKKDIDSLEFINGYLK